MLVNMKYGVVISVSKTKFGPIVFKENLKENMLKAASMGYDGVELAIRLPELLDLKSVEELTGKYGIKVIAVATGQIYVEEGLSFSDPNKTIREKALERTKKIMDIAGYFNASLIIGLVRGRVNAMDNFQSELLIAEDKIAECLESLLSYNNTESVNLLIEPINRYETNIFNKLEDVKNFLLKYKQRLDLNRIGILADTFHMNIEEPSIEKSFKKHLDFIKHIHFADSNRWPPGLGHIDFKKIARIIKAKEYEGFISFEILPLPDPDSAARTSLEYTKKIIQHKITS